MVSGHFVYNRYFICIFSTVLVIHLAYILSSVMNSYLFLCPSTRMLSPVFPIICALLFSKILDSDRNMENQKSSLSRFSR